MASPRPAQAQAPNLGAARDFGLLADGSISTPNSLPVLGRVGATQAVAATVTATQGVSAQGADNVPAALSAAQAARVWCGNLSGQVALGSLNGQSLAAGRYTLPGGTALGAGQTLTLTGDTSSIYVFNVAGSLAVPGTARLDLGQVRPDHVYWNVQGSFDAAAYAAWQGVVLSGGAAHFAGDIDGTLTVLAGGAVTFERRDVVSGVLHLTSVALHPGHPQLGVPLCGPAAPLCQGQPTNLLFNGSFEAEGCLSFHWDFGYQSPGGTERGRAGCWTGYASPDLFFDTNTFNAGCYEARHGAPINVVNEVSTIHPNANTIGQALLNARTGGVHAGIYAKDAAHTGTGLDQREHIMQELAQPLTVGQPYYAEYYASLAPASFYTLQQLQIGFLNALPVNPDPANPTLPNLNPTGPAPLLTNVNVTVSTTALTNGLNPGWDRVGGSFTPTNGNYRVMVLGNFQAGDVNTTVAGRGPGFFVTGMVPLATTYPATNPQQGAYYYIDDVLLVPFPSAGPATVAVACGGTVPLGGCPLPAGAGATYSWSPTAGLSNPSIANPVFDAAAIAGPQQTYTLTVRAGGQTHTTTTTVLVNGGVRCTNVCTHPYAANKGATFQTTNQKPVATNLFTLGNANASTWPGAGAGGQPPIIYGNGPKGPPVVFDGIYHVVSPIEFQDGTFEVRPGTVFYADGGSPWGNSAFSQCYIRVVDNRLMMRIGKDARMKATGATFTTTCDNQWGGIELLANGALETYADAKGQRTEISHARIGVLLGTPCRSTDANCLLTGTDFVDNFYGAISLGFPQERDPKRNGVMDCRFTSGLSTMLAPATKKYTQTGLTLRGNWHDGLEYSGNAFNGLYNGAEVAGGTTEMRLHGNEFRHCYGSAVVAGSPAATTRPGRILVDENDILVPDNATPGGQVAFGDTVRGIHVLPLFKGGQELAIEANRVQGENGVSGKPYKIGLDAYLNFTHHYVQRQNGFSKLDEGMRLMDSGAATTKDEYVTGNFFGGCDKGIVLTGKQYAVYAPALSCNTLEECNYGVFVADDASVGILAGPQGGPGPLGFEPVANQYVSVGFEAWSDSQYGTIDYYALVNSPEVNLTTGGSAFINTLSTAGTPCEQRQYSYGTGGPYGLNRPAAGSGTTAQQVQNWENSLTDNTDPAVLQHKKLLLLIDYREKNGQLSQLQTFTNTLPQVNNVAYDRLSEYLMERYRQAGNLAAAQQVRNNLLAQRGTDPEVSHRVAYYDVADHLLTLPAGARPSAADSTALAGVAGSTTGFAPVACATLRYYYPTCACASVSGRAVANAARQLTVGGKASLAKSIQLLMYPNPAQDDFALQVVGLSGTAMGYRLQIAEVATGRVVSSQPMPEANPTVVVRGLAPGVYVGRLLGADGRSVAMGKIVIVR